MSARDYSKIAEENERTVQPDLFIRDACKEILGLEAAIVRLVKDYGNRLDAKDLELEDLRKYRTPSESERLRLRTSLERCITTMLTRGDCCVDDGDKCHAPGCPNIAAVREAQEVLETFPE